MIQMPFRIWTRGPKNAYIHHLRNTTTCGGNVACCQTNLMTCLKIMESSYYFTVHILHAF